MKPTNPKDVVGIKKAGLSVVPCAPLFLGALGMLEGARKYGRHNYRASGVLFSVYYDALMRHMMVCWEGEDIDPDSGLLHIGKALSTLFVLVDAWLNGFLIDDRPPKLKNQKWLQELHAKAADIIERYPDPEEAFTEVGEMLKCQKALEKQKRAAARRRRKSSSGTSKRRAASGKGRTAGKTSRASRKSAR